MELDNVESRAALTMSRSQAEDFLYREARLLDTMQLDEWFGLFARESLYWIPIDENRPTGRNASMIRDDHPSLEERVYHLLHLPFPAQNPRSRTVHAISNVELTACEGGIATILSNQVIYEMRRGDHAQVGLGEVGSLVSSMEHTLVHEDGEWKIRRKKILLINREMPQGNLTFLF